MRIIKNITFFVSGWFLAAFLVFFADYAWSAENWTNPGLPWVSSLDEISTLECQAEGYPGSYNYIGIQNESALSDYYQITHNIDCIVPDDDPDLNAVREYTCPDPQYSGRYWDDETHQCVTGECPEGSFRNENGICEEFPECEEGELYTGEGGASPSSACIDNCSYFASGDGVQIKLNNAGWFGDWESTGESCEVPDVPTDSPTEEGDFICEGDQCIEKDEGNCGYFNGEYVCMGTVPDGGCVTRNGTVVCVGDPISPPTDSNDNPVSPDGEGAKSEQDGEGGETGRQSWQYWGDGSYDDDGNNLEGDCGGPGQPPCNTSGPGGSGEGEGDDEGDEEGDEEGSEEGDYTAADIPDEPDLDENPWFEYEISESDFPAPQDRLPGSSECPSPITLTILDTQVEFSFEPACQLADMIRPVLIAMAYIAGLAIAFRR